MTLVGVTYSSKQSDTANQVILIDRAHTVLLFESRVQAYGYVEAVDVQDGEYEAYDGLGRLLEWTVKQNGDVELYGPEDSTASSRLVHALQEWSVEVGVNHLHTGGRSISDLGPVELIEAAFEYERMLARPPSKPARLTNWVRSRLVDRLRR